MATTNNHTRIEDSLQCNDHAILTAINEWERHSIGKIQLAAQQARNDLQRFFDDKRHDFVHLLKQMNANSTAHIDLSKLTEELTKLRQDLSSMSSSIYLEQDQTNTLPIYLIQLGPKNNDRLDEEEEEDMEKDNINVPGTQHLTITRLRQMTLVEQKQVLGERLFVLVQQIEPKLAAKMTGMFVELDVKYILMLIKSPKLLKDKIKEALNVLQVHQYRQRHVIES